MKPNVCANCGASDPSSAGDDTHVTNLGTTEPDAVERSETLLREALPKVTLQQLEAAVQDAPHDLNLLFQLGVVYQRLGHTKQAVRSFRRVLESRPRNSQVALHLAQSLQEGGSLELAFNVLSKLLTNEPQHLGALVSLGGILCEMGELDEALRVYEQTLELEPDCVEAHFAMASLLVALRRYRDARQPYQRVLELDPLHLDARVELGLLNRRAVPLWHFAMLNDQERNSAFEAAITRRVRPGDMVLDIGCGSGLLSLMAARAGARRVLACEVVGPIANSAREIVATNGYRECIEVIEKHSTSLTIRDDLKARADLCIAEVLDATLIGEGILPTVRHARTHLLKPEGRIIPARASIIATLVESEALWRESRVEGVAGLDLRAFNRFAPTSPFQKAMDLVPHRTLSEPSAVFDFDFEGWPPLRGTTVLKVPVVAPGLVQAVMIWFELVLDEETTLSSAPGKGSLHWLQAVQMVESREVKTGDFVELRAHHSECNLHFEVAYLNPDYS